MGWLHVHSASFGSFSLPPLPSDTQVIGLIVADHLKLSVSLYPPPLLRSLSCFSPHALRRPCCLRRRCSGCVCYLLNTCGRKLKYFCCARTAVFHVSSGSLSVYNTPGSSPIPLSAHADKALLPQAPFVRSVYMTVRGLPFSFLSVKTFNHRVPRLFRLLPASMRVSALTVRCVFRLYLLPLSVLMHCTTFSTVYTSTFRRHPAPDAYSGINFIGTPYVCGYAKVVTGHVSSTRCQILISPHG